MDKQTKINEYVDGVIEQVKRGWKGGYKGLLLYVLESIKEINNEKTSS